MNHLGELRTLISAQKKLYKECLVHLDDVDAFEDDRFVLRGLPGGLPSLSLCVCV